jgi:hypothetical protein
MYTVGKAPRGEYMVVLNRTCRPVFFGTKAECNEWLERNGHDGDV